MGLPWPASLSNGVHPWASIARARGIKCQRVLSDNGSGYRSRVFREGCADLALRHRRTRPYTPRTNGKASPSSRRCCASGRTSSPTIADRPYYTPPMAMGKRRRRGTQPTMWVATQDLPQGAGHPFYVRLNQVLDAAHFDEFVETQCTAFYATDGPAESAPRPLLPAAAARLLRRPRLGAGDRVAGRRFAQSAQLSRSHAR